jgi:hypothetical protein
MELHREPPLHGKTKVSLMDREIRRRCFWACFVLDRFLACGSLRPMLIRDNDIKLRLPSTRDSFVAGEPIEGPFFSTATFRSSTSGIGPISDEMAFIGIISILGRATSYLQHGGVKGDTHFPWHSNSTLASLRAELAVWYSSVSEKYRNANSLAPRDGAMALLTVNCYHLIHCLIFRDFLPVVYQREGVSTATTAVHQTWHAETTEACINNANEIVKSLQAAFTANIPPFAGFCLFIAATVHLHGWHWNIPQLSPRSKEYLTFELRSLLEMKKMWAGLDNLVLPFVTMLIQGDCIRIIYASHSKLISVPRKPDGSGIFDSDGFMGRYARYSDNLDSSFCAVKTQPAHTPSPDTRQKANTIPYTISC